MSLRRTLLSSTVAASSFAVAVSSCSVLACGSGEGGKGEKPTPPSTSMRSTPRRSRSCPAKVFPVVGHVVGIHERAMTVGMTVPIQYVRRWNARMTGSESPRGYATARITLDQGEVAALLKWAESIGLQASVVSPQ